MSTAYAPKNPGDDAAQQADQVGSKSGRAAGGKFAPGNTFSRGVASGRIKGFAGFAREIQERSGYGQELLDYAFGVFRNEEMPFEQRWKALEFLTERAYGKAIQPAELQVHIAKEAGEQKRRLPVERFTPEQLEQWNRLLGILADEKSGAPQAIQARALPVPEAAAGEVEGQVVEEGDDGRDLDAGESE